MYSSYYITQKIKYIYKSLFPFLNFFKRKMTATRHKNLVIYYKQMKWKRPVTNTKPQSQDASFTSLQNTIFRGKKRNN